MKYFLLASTLLFLVACSTHSFKGEIQEVERLHSQIDSIEIVFKSIDLEKAVSNNIKVEQDANALKMYVENYPEAFDNKLGVLIDELRIAKKVFSRIEKNHPKIQEEINYSRKQLKDLNADLENDKLSVDMANSYLTKEIKAVNELIKNVSMLKQNEKIGVVKYEGQLDLIEDYKQRQN